MGFPSPYGDYFFNFKACYPAGTDFYLMRFRPLMGIIFLTNKYPVILLALSGRKFPSPYGDYFFNLAPLTFNVWYALWKFPSPYGDYFFNKKVAKKYGGEGINLRFRPLMGIIFLTH